MIRTVSDPAILNRFAAHPDIAPHIGGPLDFTNAMHETSVFLFGDHGGFLFTWTGPETYEVHVMLTKAGRGRWGVQAGREAMRRVGGHLWARMHPERPQNAVFARLCGFRDTGTTHELDAGQGPVRWHIYNWRA